MFAQNQNLGVGDAASFIKDPTDDAASPTTATIVGIIEHILGHSAYLVNDRLLFTGDSLAINDTGGYCFFDIFNLDSDLNKKSLWYLKERMADYDLKAVFTSHNGWTEDVKGAFAHVDTIPIISKANPFDKTAPYDCFEEQE